FSARRSSAPVRTRCGIESPVAHTSLLNGRFMAPERSASAQWDVLTAELWAYREQQKQTWGELDNALLGSYLAGEVTAGGRRAVQALSQDPPEPRNPPLLALVPLNEFAPPSPEPPAPPPRLLPFTGSRKARRPFLSRLRERGALVAAACLLLALGLALLKQPAPDRTDHTVSKRVAEVASLKQPGKLAEPRGEPQPPAPASASSVKLAGAKDTRAARFAKRAPDASLEKINQVALWAESQPSSPYAPYFAARGGSPYSRGAWPYGASAYGVGAYGAGAYGASPYGAGGVESVFAKGR